MLRRECPSLEDRRLSFVLSLCHFGASTIQKQAETARQKRTLSGSETPQPFRKGHFSCLFQLPFAAGEVDINICPFPVRRRS